MDYRYLIIIVAGLIPFGVMFADAWIRCYKLAAHWCWAPFGLGLLIFVAACGMFGITCLLPELRVRLGLVFALLELSNTAEVTNHLGCGER